jgi:hypothetical protein
MRKTGPFWICVLVSEATGRRYVSQTDDLPRRVAEHNRAAWCNWIPCRFLAAWAILRRNRRSPGVAGSLPGRDPVGTGVVSPPGPPTRDRGFRQPVDRGFSAPRARGSASAQSCDAGKKQSGRDGSILKAKLQCILSLHLCPTSTASCRKLNPAIRRRQRSCCRWFTTLTFTGRRRTTLISRTNAARRSDATCCFKAVLAPAS